ncbi:permease-like cell division protein FtsX [Candidatus Woesebacteria bacterium]|jgi:cell division transport system permease protein|nr:permease-like cell division protein FtsX [Candidatus Woesebacteria bacterium]HNV45197.1 permease-like cell division protein FtsX [Candidatus Woesebacteria bacterium]HOA11781.1 permease-like cell division protein FtsX [Candidatus Woesebacteria bacterium]HOC07235.1 permease-like cell division protein FtsX [Candidatus Woesebacteria bacterium]HOI05132.1 permease-like cell division protein FtsX [Candidatus Woesebacteria bacterium]
MKSFNSALTAIRRSPYQSILSIIVLTLTFFIAFTFSIMTIGSQKVLQYFETQPRVIAFFRLETENAEIDKLAEELRAKDYVKDINIVDKAEALEIYRQENQDNPLLLELVTEDILPASIEVSAYNAENLEEISQILKNNQFVEDVDFQQDVMQSLIRWTNALRLFGLFFLGILLIVSFLMIMVTISLKVSAKRNSIKVMKFIGASNQFISRPYLLEGIILSIIASILAFAFYLAMLLYVTPWLSDFLQGIIEFPVSWQFLLYQFLLGLIAAVLLGTFASLTAVKRMLKK